MLTKETCTKLERIEIFHYPKLVLTNKSNPLSLQKKTLPKFPDLLSRLSFAHTILKFCRSSETCHSYIQIYKHTETVYKYNNF